MTISALLLEKFCRDLLLAASVAEPKAVLVANSLVAANLRGVDSHGVQLLSFYLEQFAVKNIDVHTDGQVVSENGACLTYDGQNGIGQWISEICCSHAIRLAKTHGISIVTARESNHFGAAAFWAQRISSAGLIGIIMCNASPLVAPWQGKEARFGTNPICMSVPGPDSWLLDMATTTVALGKIMNAMNHDRAEIPAGWAMDKEGVPTTSTETALSGLLMPLGGYKGSGLAMMAEILCALLSGGAMSSQLGALRVPGQPMRVGQVFLAVDVTRFMPMDVFVERMRMLIALVKSSSPAKGYDEVLVAGEPEWRQQEQRSKNGIAVSPGVWQALANAAEKLSVRLPD
jgi:LDH2 family malate/lactate/ureidoglycolate dehydrogenase